MGNFFKTSWSPMTRLSGHVNRVGKLTSQLDDSIILRLPREVLLFSVVPLLTVKDIVYLDSAIGCHEINNCLYDRLQNMLSSGEIWIKLANQSKKDWLLARKIYPHYIKLFCGIQEKELLNMRCIVSKAKSLSMNYCWMLSPRSSAYFLASCESLLYLDLSFCRVNFKVLKTVSKTCKLLNILNVSNSLKLSGLGLVEVLQRCGALRELRMNQCSALEERRGQPWIVQATAHCVKLERLHMLRACIANLSWGPLVTSHAPSLRELDLSFTSAAGPVATILSIAQHCTELRILMLACAVTTMPVNDAVCELARRCCLLEELDLSGRAMLGNSAVEAVSEHCKALKVLRINRCPGITDDALVVLGVRSSCLQELCCAQCHQINTEGISLLLERLPALHCNHYSLTNAL